MKIVDKKEMQTATTTTTKTTTNKGRKEQGGTEAIVSGSELNNFVVHLS